ncbi:MAG: M23 family metallopeptidase [Firmicutes bacterium]|nr:M23 family metallopeptidase [Bacillota bacterium]
MKNNNKLSELLSKKGFYIAIYASAAVIVALAGIISYTDLGSSKESTDINRTEIRNDPVDVPIDTPLDTPVDNSDVKSYLESEDTVIRQHIAESATEEITISSSAENDPPDKNTAPSENVSETPAAAQQSSHETAQADTFTLFDDTQEMIWPVAGQILMDYSVETAVYDKTLDQYRTHDSLCISADEGTPVAASAAGKVAQVFDCEQTGSTVVIEHGNGWLSTYGQLADVSVSEGDIVSGGEIIAKVAQPTRSSVALGTHLDFKLTKDNTATDPKLMLAQLDE